MRDVGEMARLRHILRRKGKPINEKVAEHIIGVSLCARRHIFNLKWLKMNASQEVC